MSESREMLLVTRVVASLLLAGVVVFAVIAVLLTLDKEAEGMLLTTIATAVAGVMVVARFVVPGAVANAMRPKGDPRHESQASLIDRLSPVYQTKTILAYGMLEGAALFCVTAYIIEVHWLALLATSGVAIVMAATFPTPAKYQRWVDAQQQLMQLEQ